MTKPTDNTLNLIARVRVKSNALIIQEMQRHGIDTLQPSHGDILVTLFKHGSLSMSDIAQHIHRDPSTITTLVKKLSALGFVSTEPNPEDRRSHLVSLTDEGEALKPVFKHISELLYEIAYQDLSDRDRQTFRTTLKQILNNLTRFEESPE